MRSSRAKQSHGWLAWVLHVGLALFFLSRPLQAQNTTRLYVPVLQAATNAHLGIGLSNPVSAVATVTLTARGYDGLLIGVAQVTIPAFSQRAFLAEDVFGAGIVSRAGWIQFDSSVAGVKGLYTVFDLGLTFIDGSDLQATPSNRLIFPKVSASSTFAFVHTGSSSTRVGVSLFDNAGNLVAQANRDLNAYSGFIGPLSALLPGVASTDGYVVVESSGTPTDTLVGMETYRNQSDIALLNAIPDSSRARTGFIPHLIAFSVFVSRFTLVNPTNQAQTVTLTAENLESNGQTSAPITANRTIAANGRMEENIVSLFGLSSSALLAGSIRWQTQGDSAGVVGFLDYGTTDGGLLSAVPAQTSGYSDLFFSHVAQGSGFYTGLAFLNPNVQATVIAIDVFNQDGIKMGSAVLTLAPGARISRLLSELIPGFKDQLSGYVRATASRPVMAFQLFGATSGTFLANVSAQGVRLTPQVSGGQVDASTGAEVLSADGSVSLLIPPGALTANTAVSVSSVTATSFTDPSGTQRVVGVVQADPPTTFRIPVALTFPLSAQLDPGTEIPLLISRAGVYDTSEFTAVVDPSGRTATARVKHFSTYVVPFDAFRIFTVTSVNPSSGSAGTSVTINGQGFSPVAGNNYVTFAAADNQTATATVTAVTAGSLTVTVPPAAISGDVVVRVATQTSRGVRFDVTGYNPRPAIFSISPNRINLGSSSVALTIRGVGFRSASAVTVDGKTVTTTFVDSTQLQVTLSGDQVSAAVHQIVVTNPAPGGGSSNIAEFTVGNPAPSISSLSPAVVLAGTPVTVSITGSGFVPNSVVYVNGIAAPGSFVNGTTMRVPLSSEQSGIKLITVFNPAPGGGTSNGIAFRFTSPTDPTLTLIAPATGVANSAPTITFTGTNFVSGSTTVAVSGVGVTASNFVVSSATSMTARFTIDPTAPLSAHDVTVTVANRGTSLPLTFTVVPPAPGIGGLSVTGASQGQTISETITGSNFIPGGTTVQIGGSGVHLSNINVQNSTTITLTISIDKTATPGQYPIVVSTEGGSAQINFTVNAAP
jgi:IPT/TIG domain